MSLSNRIMKIQKSAGLPVVPGAAFIETNGPEWWVAYGPRAPGINTKWINPVYAFLWEASANIFAVFSDDDNFKTIDPANTGKVMKDWKAVPGNLTSWPVSPGWRADGSTSTTAEPSVPASCGLEELNENLKNAIAISP